MGTAPRPRARPFRLTAPVIRELHLHEAVARALAFLVQKPAEWTTFPAGSVPLPPRYAAKLHRMGLQRGWPDILLIYQGSIYGIELKRPGASISKTKWARTQRGGLRELVGQNEMFPRLEAAGMQIAVCRSVDDVIDQLAAWEIPMRGHH
jgi:hypothetical protein